MRYLSYPFSTINPVYGNPSLKMDIGHVKSILRGDSCNVMRFTMENHWGTHIDCPAHFFERGAKITDYAAEMWVFRKPFVVNLALLENQLIMPQDIRHVSEGSDLVLIKSDFSRYRGTEKYSVHNPGISSEVAEWLREKHPSVRAIGFDFISISPYQNREVGRKAHQAFLNSDDGSMPLLIIEDMDLSPDLTGLKEVMAFPLRIIGLDSAPCTVIGIFS